MKQIKKQKPSNGQPSYTNTNNIKTIRPSHCIPASPITLYTCFAHRTIYKSWLITRFSLGLLVRLPITNHSFCEPARADYFIENLKNLRDDLLFQLYTYFLVQKTGADTCPTNFTSTAGEALFCAPGGKSKRFLAKCPIPSLASL